MASNSQFTEMFLEWPLSKIVSEMLTCPWTWPWWMGATWLYEHKQIPKKSSLKLLVRFWNNLIEMFLEWPFSELFLKFWSFNKHGISEWRLLALHRHKEILVNSSLKTRRRKWLEQSQKIRWAILALLFFIKLVRSTLRLDNHLPGENMVDLDLDLLSSIYCEKKMRNIF